MSRLETLASFPGTVQSSGPGRGPSIGEYLIRRLRDYGIKDVFGIPGDYILSFYSLLQQSPLRVVGCTREDCAGFAADAYARVNGMGALCVTYCVGGLSVCNSIAGAYAEKSAVVMITGSPGLDERINNPLLHHKVRDFRTQIDVFEKLCVAVTELSDPVIAFREIDRVLDAAARFKRPVYIDIPRDMVHVVPHISHLYQPSVTPLDNLACHEAAEEAATLLAHCKKPMILAGVEIHRFGLNDKVIALAEKLQIPMAATLLGKSVIPEKHPLYMGIYEGAMGQQEVTQMVEESDCVLLLGAFMTDINLGIFTANLDPAKCIYVTSEMLRIRHHHFHNVGLSEFLDELSREAKSAPKREIPAALTVQADPFELAPAAPITISRLMARVDQQIDENTIVIADVGDALFSATELTIHQRTEFISPAYYTSMGFAVPATLGALVARPDRRVIAFVGDGAFQMTGMELSTIVRLKLAPIVVVLDNGGYGTERYLQSGNWPYNEIHPWRYAELTKVLSGGIGYEVSTEGEFDAALSAAWKDSQNLSLIHVHLPHDDASSGLRRLAQRLGERV